MSNLSSKTFSGICTLTSFDGTVTSKPSEKGEIFNEYFKSVFTAEDLNNIPDKGTSPHPSIPELNITLQRVTICFLTVTRTNRPAQTV